MNKTDQIRKVVKERWPLWELPRGEMSRIAREFDTTPSLVSYVVKNKGVGGPKDYSGTKAAQIRNVILKRWPCMEVPNGEQSKLADEFGVSRELVRQQVAKLGYGVRYGSQEQQYQCVDCERLVKKDARNGRCGFCQKKASIVDLTCEQCGKTFQRSITNVRSAVANPRSRGRIFCTRQCFYLHASEYMKEYRRLHKWGPEGRKSE